MAGNKETNVSSYIEVFTTEKLTQEIERIATKYQDMEFHKHPSLGVSKGGTKRQDHEASYSPTGTL